jgi:hypothetical protein
LILLAAVVLVAGSGLAMIENSLQERLPWHGAFRSPAPTPREDG